MTKIYKFYPLLLILSAFSPYVVKSLGIKAEHVIIVPVFLVSLVIALMNRVKVNKEIIPLLFLWICFLALVTLRTLFSTETPAGMSAVAEFGNFLMPLLIMFFYFFNFNREEVSETELISKVLRLFNILLILNSFLIIFSIAGFNTDAILKFYWKGFVARDSLGNGRYTGIFNQPMESGLAYSIGVLGWLYLIEKQSKITIKNLAGIILLMIGGVASVSKVFILGGFLLFCWGAFRNKGVRKSLVKVMFILTPLVIGAYQLLKQNWSGMDYLMRFFTIQDGQLLDTLTSGRFGGVNTMQTLFSSIWHDHPFVGLGLGQNDVADSQWFQIFGSSGAIGFMIFIAFTGILIKKALEYRVFMKGAGESKLFESLVILSVIAGIGAPVFTLNRSSSVLWVLISMLLMYKNKYKSVDVTVKHVNLINNRAVTVIKREPKQYQAQ